MSFQPLGTKHCFSGKEEKKHAVYDLLYKNDVERNKYSQFNHSCIPNIEYKSLVDEQDRSPCVNYHRQRSVTDGSLGEHMSYLRYLSLFAHSGVQIRVITKLSNTEQSSKGKELISQQTDKISQQPENWENRNGPDLIQVFPKKWWVESNFTAPNLRLPLRLKGSVVTITAFLLCCVFGFFPFVLCTLCCRVLWCVHF